MTGTLSIALLMGGLLAGCGGQTASVPLPATRAAAQTVPACAAFENRTWAQTVFDGDLSGNAALDPDRDGLACEELALGAAPALWTEMVPALATPVELASVIDGDTVVVIVDGVRERVRLVGIDAHEAGGPYPDVECFGPEATGFLQSLLGSGGQLAIEKDQEERDRYGRLLRWIWLDRGDGEVYLLNEALVRAGYAERYRNTPNRRYLDEIVDAESFARRHGLGLWDACQSASAD